MTSQDLDSGDEQCECICSIIRSQKNSYVSISHEAPRSTMFQVCSFYLTSPSHLTIRSCMRDIFGARFHCAICVDVDICSNCESAGLPGNLHSSEGGHDSSHILIKVKRVSSIDTHMAHIDSIDSLSLRHITGSCRLDHISFHVSRRLISVLGSECKPACHLFMEG